SNRLVQRLVFRRRGKRHSTPSTRHPEKRTEKIEIKVERANNAANEVLGLTQAFEARHHPVLKRVKLEINQGGDQLFSVALKKTSSRLASPGWLENRREISSMVPTMILRPFLRIKMWEQISSTR